MKNLIREIHRRSLWQVLGIYAAASWIVLQVIDVVGSNFGLPEWVAPAGLILLLIGLPIVLATAFVQEGAGTAQRLEGDGASPGSGADPGPAPRSSPGGASPDPHPAGTPATPGSASPHGTGRGAPHRWLTWRNAVLGGVGAFALLGLAAGGYLAMRSLGIGPAASLVAAGVLDARDQVVLADFQTRTGEEELAAAATELLRVGLSQSQVVRLLQPAAARSVLERMQRPADAELDPQLAREVALRAGLPAVIAGEINRAGSSYALTAHVVTAEAGEELVAYSETARDSSDIIGAVDELSRRLREKIGESLRLVHNERPLEAVTTADLEALRKYSQAVHATEVGGDDDRAIALLEEAVERDTAFAMAWRKLGILLANNQQEPARRVDALTRAFRHRERLTEAERYLAMGTYYQWVTSDWDRAITAYENLLDIDPQDVGALNNLSLIYGQLDDWERAEELRHRALAADSTLILLYQNLIAAQVANGKFEEAAATLDLLRDRAAEHDETVLVMDAQLAAARGEYGAASESFRALAAANPGNLRVEAAATFAVGSLAGIRGRSAELSRHMESAALIQERRGLPASALGAMVWAARYEALVTRDVTRGRALVDEALSRYSLESLDPVSRPYQGLISLRAQLGQPAEARRLLDEYTAEVDAALRDQEDFAALEGEIARAEGRHEEAIAAHLRAERGRCARRCPGLAVAYDAAGRADSALAIYERYVTSPSSGGAVYQDVFARGPFLERLGQLYDERGDLENAAKYYAMFVELWAEADEGLQPRVRAAQQRLEEIVRERG